MSPLVLASSSPYRRALLARLGIKFSNQSPAIDETPEPGESAKELVQRLSIDKAKTLHHAEQITIGSDQSASIEGTLLHKPGTHKRAFEQLTLCSGQIVTFYTGVCVISNTGKTEFECIETDVEFCTLTQAQISTYIKKEQPFDCAGSFKCEGLGISLFKRISSDDPTALEGLPLITLCKLLRNAGLDPLL